MPSVVLSLSSRSCGAADGLLEGSNLDQRRAMDRFLAGVERRAFRIAVLAVNNEHDALDIVQDAMIRLARSYGGRDSQEWAPLFYRILQNRILDHHRRQSVRRRLFGWIDRRADADEAPDPIAEAADREQVQPEHRVAMGAAIEDVDAAVRALPARQREAFLLRAMEGMDVAATAAAMGCSQGSVKTHYSRAVHRLREILGDHWL